MDVAWHLTSFTPLTSIRKALYQHVTTSSVIEGPARINLNFKKYRLFVRLKFYHLKNIEQTDGDLARRKNNGDNKPFSKNRCIIIIFQRMNSLFTEDIWERTVYDRDGKILLVRSIERFSCFRPLAFATQKNTY